MLKFPKIQNLFSRDRETGKIVPEIRPDTSIEGLTYLNKIRLEEKLDGSNSQLALNYDKDVGVNITICSRNNELIDKDVMYIADTINKMLDLEKIKNWYYTTFCLKDGEIKEVEKITEVKIFGETIGSKIQKNHYTQEGRDFIGFDILIGTTWLAPKIRDDIFAEIDITPVPTIATLYHFPTYKECYELLYEGFFTPYSLLAEKYGRIEYLEGYILRPPVVLYDCHRNRLIGKIKRKDFLTKKEIKEIEKGGKLK